MFGPIAYIIKGRVEGLRDFGPCISPFNSFLFIQGIETLKFRMERTASNALAVAQWLEKHAPVAWVKYPGAALEPVLCAFAEVPAEGRRARSSRSGSRAALRPGGKLIDSVQIFSHLANLGDAKSLIIHPASTTHQQLNAEQQRAAGVSPRWCGSRWNRGYRRHPLGS